MKRYQYDSRRPIDKFGSRDVSISPLMRIVESHVNILQVACMHLEKDGLIGGHEAAVPQMFVIVNGEGWVAGEDRTRHPIQAGQAVLWDAGEWHETSTRSGLTAIVIETDTIVPFPAFHEISN
ncbi:MAG TPA: cupin [Bacillales bacterium]|nr:cupin [Bacillales bacterium]